MKRHLLFVLALLLFAGGWARDGYDRWIRQTELPNLALRYSYETRDRNDTLLRAYTVADGRWRLSPIPLDTVDPGYLSMLIAYEDQRFYRHNGVDPLAILRTGWQAMLNGRVVSGASTLTMQLARLLEDSGTGSWQGKFRQIRLALALERQMSKEEILSLYLSLAPFGGNLEGIRAASLAYFDKEPSRLSPGQAALLVSLPQSPETRRPDLHPIAAETARNRVLNLLRARGLIASEDIEAAAREPIPVTRRSFPMLAPHLSDLAITEAPRATIHRLTIDARLQASLESLTETALLGHDPRLSIAMLVADYRTGEVLGSVGSPGYADTGRSGYVDMTRALRSPGSTLKPFVYALSFDQGIAHPATLIDDVPVHFGAYAPQNFDGRFRGELRIAEALRRSLNIPVVLLLNELGPAHLMTALRQGGADPVVPRGQPGLAIALGGIGVTMHDLVTLYGGLARGGVTVELTHRAGEAQPLERRFLSERAAWQVVSVLARMPSPFGSDTPRFAYKTGTSYGSRDTWAVGFDGAHVAAVWIGRADGSAVPGAFGAELAAPVLFEVFQRLKPEPELLQAPSGRVTEPDGLTLPERLLRFTPRAAVDLAGNHSLRILFPPSESEMLVDGGRIPLKLQNGQPPFIWMLDGEIQAIDGRTREAELVIATGGQVKLTVLDARGVSDNATFWVVRSGSANELLD